MRRFGTQGPVNPQEHYIVSRTEEIADFLSGFMHIEVPTGRGRMDIIIIHNRQKYIVEQKFGEATIVIRQAKSNSQRISALKE